MQYIVEYNGTGTFISILDKLNNLIVEKKATTSIFSDDAIKKEFNAKCVVMNNAHEDRIAFESEINKYVHGKL